MHLEPYLTARSGATSILDEMKNQIKAKAALPESLSGSNVDHVIAMRLSSWPKDVEESISAQFNAEMLKMLKSN